MNAALRTAVACCAGALAALLAVAILRPLLPVDETRYMTVAWEMWASGNLLVPHLNGVPYADKPPLLFWLIQLAWSGFGEATWAARLVPLAAAVATLAAVLGLARELWPQRPRLAPDALVLAASSGLLLLFATLVRFDLLVTACAAVALLGIARAGLRGGWHGWPLAAVALGLGLIAKGPVVLVFALPAALFAPLWLGRRPVSGWVVWYLGLVAAIAGAVAIGLAWALPAASSGGTDYGNSMLWHQTSDRVADAHDHAQPFWFYLAVLPVLLLPWLVWPPLWRGLAACRREGRDNGLRFCLIGLLVPFVVMTFVSAKQIHYLLPAIPLLALAVARLADGRPGPGLAPLGWLLAVLGTVGSLVLLIGPMVAGATAAAYMAEVALAGPVLLAVAGLVLILAGRSGRLDGPRGLLAGALAVVVGVHLGGAGGVFARYDLQPVADLMAEHQMQGLAWGHDYAGEVGYLGRLAVPVEEVASQDFAAWLAAHPGGVAVLHYREPPELGAGPPTIQLAYRGRTMGLWIGP